MKQVVQPISGGAVRVIDVPPPSIGATEVLVRTMASVLSPGTERAVTRVARGSLLTKARSRPDLVRQVIAKAKVEGLGQTARAVRWRLRSDVPLGYSAAGVVVEVGEAVPHVVPGTVVATAGAGKANHAELQAVPGLLCVPVPEGVSASEASFAGVASIPLHALRLAEIGPGAKIAVVGLGLIGQLAVRLALAAGCQAVGIDVDRSRVDRARSSGAAAFIESGDDTTAAVLDWSRGRGADVVLLCAADRSPDAVRRAPAICRDRADIVVVGDLGLDLERTPFYQKELTLRFSRSYGPGRYERGYEDWAVDYPPGHVRWTEGRNLEAILDLLSARRVAFTDLITHTFDIREAANAYQVIEARSEQSLAVQLTYPEHSAAPGAEPAIPIRPRRVSTGAPGIGLIGAGAFAQTVLLPALRQAGFDRLVSVTSASGLSARRLAERAGFERAVSGGKAVIDDPEVGVVVIATPHDTHAALAVQALRAGKHVFSEKPLALTVAELDQVEAAWRASDGVLFVGFNRRWSRPVELVRQHLEGGAGPLLITYRVNGAPVPDAHWYHDRRQGGRLLGEVCHFVDTCAAITGLDADHATSATSGAGERLLCENLVVSLRYPDGSLAAVTYGTGAHPTAEKERIEISGRGHVATVLDFRRVVLDGRVTDLGAQDKGYRQEAARFRRAVAGHCDDAPGALASTRTTLAAAAALSASEAAGRQPRPSRLGPLDQEEPPEPVP